MEFLKKLFRGQRAGQRSDSRGGAAFVPSDDSNDEILACVLQYIWLAEMGECQAGRRLPQNNDIGPRTTSELEALQHWRRSHSFSYAQLENAFWCPDFVRAYHRGSTTQKAEYLASLGQNQFLVHVDVGRSARPRVEADGVVYYLVTIAFEMLGIDVDRYLSRH